MKVAPKTSFQAKIASLQNLHQYTPLRNSVLGPLKQDTVSFRGAQSPEEDTPAYAKKLKKVMAGEYEGEKLSKVIDKLVDKNPEEVFNYLTAQVGKKNEHIQEAGLSECIDTQRDVYYPYYNVLNTYSVRSYSSVTPMGSVFSSSINHYDDKKAGRIEELVFKLLTQSKLPPAKSLKLLEIIDNGSTVKTCSHTSGSDASYSRYKILDLGGYCEKQGTNLKTLKSDLTDRLPVADKKIVVKSRALREDQEFMTIMDSVKEEMAKSGRKESLSIERFEGAMSPAGADENLFLKLRYETEGGKIVSQTSGFYLPDNFAQDPDTWAKNFINTYRYLSTKD